jgi:hypothetical protein
MFTMPMCSNGRGTDRRKCHSCCCNTVAFVSVAMRTCLPSCCPETAKVYPPILQSKAMALNATICFHSQMVKWGGCYSVRSITDN